MSAGTSVDGTKIGRLRAKSGWSRLPAVTAYAVSGSSDAADFQASSAPASPAQNRAMPRLSCTAALFGCSPESWVSPATVPFGQVLNASPIRASSELCRAKSFSASARLPAS